MRKLFVLILSLGSIGVGFVGAQQGEQPAWAYNVVNTPPPAGQPAAAPDDGSPKKLPGSSGAFTLAADPRRLRSGRLVSGDHPTMPPIVASGKKPDVRACSLCHYPNGKGRPENAGVAGLPAPISCRRWPTSGAALARARSRARPTRTS